MERRKKRIERQYKNIKKFGHGTVDEKLIATEICKIMGWDYWIYLKQPLWFIDLIMMKMAVDSEYAEIEIKKLKSMNG